MPQSKSFGMPLLCAMILLLGCAHTSAAESTDTHAALRKVVVERHRAGARPAVYLTLFGEKLRGKIEQADAKNLIVKAKGNTFPPLAWDQLSDQDLAGIGKAYADSGADHLALARMYLHLQDFENMRAACTTAQDKDKGTAAEIAELLKQVPASPAPVPAKPAHPTEAPDVSNGETPPTNAGSKPNLAALTGLATPGAGAGAGGQRVHHTGRPLGAIPQLTEPAAFNSPQSDAVLSNMQIFPADNPWNQSIADKPVHPLSEKMIANMSPDKALFPDMAMNWVIVPANQPKLDITGVKYPRESDKGPFPIPDNTPIEGWPSFWQRNVPPLETYQREGNGDRHAMIIDPYAGKLYEFYQMRRTETGWSASCAAVFDLNSNALRPKGWTSTDAAGLPVFAGVVRYDELQRGAVEHAVRVTFSRTRKAYVHPARHHAGRTDDPAFPAMGQRLRLKATADLKGLSKPALALAKALQTYGLIVADNGSDWYFQVALDKRIDVPGLKEINRFKGRDFEVVAPDHPPEK